MKTISSLRRSYTMRVLILIAFVACAAAAPSGFLKSVPIVPFFPTQTLFRAPIAAPIAAVPIAVPTVSPGDVQAATIDAQVKAEDQARAFADQARELSELAAENQNEGVVEANDLTKEKSDLAFWTAEEEKQRVLDAERVAAAQADAALARNAYVPYVDTTVSETAEQPMPEAAAKAAEMPAPAPEAEKQAEAPKEEAVKMAEPEPEAKADNSDSVQVEAADMKTETAPMEPKKPVGFPAPVIASILSPGAYNPFIAPVAYIQPGLPAIATPTIYSGHFITSQV